MAVVIWADARVSRVVVSSTSAREHRSVHPPRARPGGRVCASELGDNIYTQKEDRSENIIYIYITYYIYINMLHAKRRETVACNAIPSSPCSHLDLRFCEIIVSSDLLISFLSTANCGKRKEATKSSVRALRASPTLPHSAGGSIPAGRDDSTRAMDLLNSQIVGGRFATDGEFAGMRDAAGDADRERARASRASERAALSTAPFFRSLPFLVVLSSSLPPYPFFLPTTVPSPEVSPT